MVNDQTQYEAALRRHRTRLTIAAVWAALGCVGGVVLVLWLLLGLLSGCAARPVHEFQLAAKAPTAVGPLIATPEQLAAVKAIPRINPRMPYYWVLTWDALRPENREIVGELARATGGIGANAANVPAVALAAAIATERGVSMALYVDAQTTADVRIGYPASRIVNDLMERAKELGAPVEVVMFHVEVEPAAPPPNFDTFYWAAKCVYPNARVGWYDGPAAVVRSHHGRGVKAAIPPGVMADVRSFSMYKRDADGNRTVLDDNGDKDRDGVDDGAALLGFYSHGFYTFRWTGSGAEFRYDAKVRRSADDEAACAWMLMAQALRRDMPGIWIFRDPLDSRDDFNAWINWLRCHSAGANSKPL